MPRSLFSLICLFFILASAVAEAGGHKIKPDEFMKSFKSMDQRGFSIFKNITGIRFQEKYNTQLAFDRIDAGDFEAELAPVVRMPFGFAKHFTFSLQKIKKDFYFGMLGGTWMGIDTLYPTHGGGYAYPMLVKKMGYKQTGEIFTYMFWSRQEAAVHDEDKRMRTDLLHPILAQAQDTKELMTYFKSDKNCQTFLQKNPHTDTLYCSIIQDVVFDYLLVEFAPKKPDSLVIRGRKINQDQDQFVIKMKR